MMTARTGLFVTLTGAVLVAPLADVAAQARDERGSRSERLERGEPGGASREIQFELRQNWKDCSGRGGKPTDPAKAECAKVCKEALDMSTGQVSGDVNAKIEECRALSAPIRQAGQDMAAGRVLRSGYEWMPDVEATIGKARNGLVVVGRDDDWGRYCTLPRLNFGTDALEAHKAGLFKRQGTRVRLTNVQFRRDSLHVNNCIVGNIIILD